MNEFQARVMSGENSNTYYLHMILSHILGRTVLLHFLNEDYQYHLHMPVYRSLIIVMETT